MPSNISQTKVLYKKKNIKIFFFSNKEIFGHSNFVCSKLNTSRTSVSLVSDCLHLLPAMFTGISTTDKVKPQLSDSVGGGGGRLKNRLYNRKIG